MESDKADPVKDYQVEVQLKKLIKEQYGKVTQKEFLEMEEEFNKFRRARKEMLLFYKGSGWKRKTSLSRDQSLDSKSVKTIAIKEEPPKRMGTRKSVKVLNHSKNGFDIIKL